MFHNFSERVGVEVGIGVAKFWFSELEQESESKIITLWITISRYIQDGTDLSENEEA